MKLCGLPQYCPVKDGKPQIGPHGFHIHEVGCCEVGNKEDPFMKAGGHWNPDDQPHGSLYSLEKSGNENIVITNHIMNDKKEQG